MGLHVLHVYICTYIHMYPHMYLCAWQWLQTGASILYKAGLKRVSSLMEVTTHAVDIHEEPSAQAYICTTRKCVLACDIQRFSTDENQDLDRHLPKTTHAHATHILPKIENSPA